MSKPTETTNERVPRDIVRLGTTVGKRRGGDLGVSGSVGEASGSVGEASGSSRNRSVRRVLGSS
jgi:hypothetical protein